MTDKKYGPLLTDTQLREWQDEVHQIYMNAVRLTEVARRKDARLRRYIRRHYGIGYVDVKKKGDDENADTKTVSRL